MRTVRRTLAVVVASAAVVASLALSPSGASAAPPPVTATTAGAVYDNIPSPTPGNVVSEAFEAQSASEFGAVIHMTAGSLSSPVVTVLMSSWGCQSGSWTANNCATTPGATFSEPVTLNIRAVGPATAGSPPGALLKSVTSTFAIPFRPSANPTHCTGPNAGKWYSAAAGACYNGYATPITFHVPGFLSPAQVVVSVAYNTTHYGSSPYGEAAPCFTGPGGCGYDSLNVGLNAAPSVGSDPRPDDAYLNSSWAGAYCPGNPGVGSFVADPGCWTGYQPAIRVQRGAVQTVVTGYPSIAHVLPGLVITLTLSARLTTAAGNPVAGEPLKFYVATGYVCTGITNVNGIASCGGLLRGAVPSILSLGFTASFAGDGVLLPANGHGGLVRIG